MKLDWALLQDTLIFVVNDAIIVHLGVNLLNWTGLLEQFNDAEVLSLPQRLQEHETVDLTSLDVLRSQHSDGVWQGDCARSENI